MSEEREGEQAGAPVEETAVSSTEVRAAVERAGEVGLADAAGGATVAAAGTPSDAANPTAVISEAAISEAATSTAAISETEVSGAAGAPAATATAAPAGGAAGVPQVAARPTIAVADELPSAGPEAADPATAKSAAEPARDGEIRISADHPMAALYMQTPMPPDLKGNRGMGVIISLVATVAFAIVYAGVLALLLAPQLPPSRFVGGLIDGLLAWQSIFAVIAFFVGLVIVVLVVGRAGWWAYVLGGFLVAAFVWAATFVGAVLDAEGLRDLTRLSLDDIFSFAFLPPVIAAVLVAREVTVWFGAWIGGRGRRLTRANLEALADYESALAEAQAKRL